ncbi:MAG TPA: GldG family protein, partial [Polyangiales bacterium]
MQVKPQTPTPHAGSSAGERRLLKTAAGSASALFVLAIVVMVNYLAFRHYQRFDWTSQGMFTLSPKSKEVLRGLGKDIDIYVFMSRGEQSYASTDELLKRYTAVTQRVRVHHVDPDRDAAQFKLLAQRFGIAAGVIETGEARADVAAVVVSGDKNWHVNREDLVATDMSLPGEPDGQQEVHIKSEQALTGAIAQVTAGRATKVCVTKGHGEWSLEDSAERSLAGFKSGLHHDNITWDAFDTLGQRAVPAGCDAVFVLGPLRAFSAAEAKTLFDYLRAGGNLLLALDPVIQLDQVAVTGFEDPLHDLGVRVDRSLVLELSQDRLLSPNAAEFVVTEFGDHVTTRAMQHAARVFMTLARSVAPTGEHPGVEILMRTSDKAFGETAIGEVKQGSQPQQGPGDIPGPVALAVALQVGKGELDTQHKTGGRLIVVGDSDFLQGPLLESAELANFHLASAWAGWL